MASSFPEYTTSLSKNIRKCRKKLRQIESLEVVRRALTPDEQDKVLRKNDLRAELKYLISEYESNIKPTEAANVTSDESLNESSNADEMKRSRSSSVASEEAIQNAQNELIMFEEEVTPKKVPRADASTNPNIQVPSAPVEEAGSSIPETSPSKTQTNSAVPSSSNASSSSNTANSKKSKKTKNSWKSVTLSVTELEGHSDLVMAVDCDKDYIMSSSRDTTVRIWNMAGKEVNNLRGHTGAVTCVILLSQSESEAYLVDLPIPPAEKKQRLAITGSTDCSVRIWSLETGKEYKSIYTYNGVSAVVYLPSIRCVMTGTDGGKLELWDALNGYNHHSLHSADEEIKCLKVLDDNIYSGTSDCIIKVHNVRDHQICTLFNTELEFLNTPHVLMNLAVQFDNIYCGDDHPNLKVVSWKSGRAQVMKLRNVKSGFGTSDALFVTDKFLLSSAYDLDTGESAINVRKLPSAEYLYTLRTEEIEVGRILSIAAIDGDDNSLQIVTAGQSLCVWKLYMANSNHVNENEEILEHVAYDKELGKPAVDSDDDTEPENNESNDEDEEEESGDENENEEPQVTYESDVRPWYDSWCTIL